MTVAQVAARLLPEQGFASWTVHMVPWEPDSGVPAHVGRTFLGPRVFQFSAWLDTQEEWLQREMILHEMAHVLVGHGYHDNGWRAAAQRLGCQLVWDWRDRWDR